MDKCFLCKEESIGWINSYDGQAEYGTEKPCVVNEYKCRNCGAEYIVYDYSVSEEKKQ